MNFLVYLLFLFLEKLIPLFPLRFIQSLAKLKGKFFYYIVPVRKKIAITNLKLAFPEKTDDEISEIVKGCYINVLTVIAEFFYIPKLSAEKISRLMKISNPELVNEKLKGGKGLILISAHYGNWELGAVGVSVMCGLPLNIVVKEQTNKHIDKSINNIRTSRGNRMIEMRNSLREILTVLKTNGAIAMLGDQAAPKENVKVDFFIKDVPAFEGTARIAIKTKAAVVFGVPIRNDDGTYLLTLYEINTSKYTEPSEENVKTLTQEHVNLLIDYIKLKPDHWLWFHKRFKHAGKY